MKYGYQALQEMKNPGNTGTPEADSPEVVY